MAAKARAMFKDENALVAMIADEDTVTGFLLAGIGHKDKKRQENFLVVDNKTTQAKIEEAFRNFTAKREDIAILLITQKIAEDIRHLINDYDKVIPTILEIPSKDHPYDPSKDNIMTKVKRMTGVE
eukprot:Phypoly_transcript_27615.p1 GENE.Phypoly_transcript_27615~~Phypoly_transcript_27615.p1  ORF type:complete len:144 (+),score=27.11 Phypoly_transcript_27615:55-432(+)